MELADLVIRSRGALREFDQKHYPEAFAAFECEAAPLLRALEGRDADACARELMAALEKEQETLSRRERKLRAFENKQALAMLLGPVSLKLGGWAAGFVDTLCREWNARYPKNRFFPGRYEEIMSGFGTTILGFSIRK